MSRPLSPRQLDIVRLAADGHTDPQIATRLGLSLHTVRWEWRHEIKPRLSAVDRTHAVALAVAAELAHPTPLTRPEAAA
ncbi:helix-turn-helix transcriptional regulator [Streptomyces sp. NPDC059015]|uniref:helix-turn-helix domain-containing protein n=1 Tax=unclassified Streptomyces TaxID=2593676 RepID=UPI00367BF308